VTLRDDLRAALRAHSDFPRPGILFQDIAPVLAQPKLLERCVHEMGAPFAGRIDAVVAIEARGFMVGAPLALHLGAPFVPARKAGKLPGATFRDDYDLEYAKATLELQRGALARDARVLIVDDVLATGGTAEATTRLVEAAGARVAGYSFLLAIAALNGRARLKGETHVVLDV
jgi:adenine phosphoribosyltransferase